MKKLIYILFLFYLLMGSCLAAYPKNKVVGVMLDLKLQNRYELGEKDTIEAREKRIKKINVAQKSVERILELIEDTSYIGFYPSGNFIRRDEVVSIAKKGTLFPIILNKEETRKFKAGKFFELKSVKRAFDEEKEYIIPASLNKKLKIKKIVDSLPDDLRISSPDALGMIASDFFYLDDNDWEKYIVILDYIEESDTFEIIPARVKSIEQIKNQEKEESIKKVVRDLEREVLEEEGQKYLNRVRKVHSLYDCLIEKKNKICQIDKVTGSRKPLKEFFKKYAETEMVIEDDLERYSIILDLQIKSVRGMLGETEVKGEIIDTDVFGKLEELTEMANLELNGSIEENTEDEPLIAAPAEQKIDTKEIDWY